MNEYLEVLQNERKIKVVQRVLHCYAVHYTGHTYAGVHYAAIQ